MNAPDSLISIRTFRADASDSAVHFIVEKIRASYRSFFLEAARDALLELIAQTLRAICQCVAAQSQPLRQISSSINSSAFFVDVILHDQITTLAWKCVETIVEASQACFSLCHFARSVEGDGLMLDFFKRGAPLITSLDSLEPNQPRHSVGVIVDVADFHALFELSGEAIKRFVG